MSIEVRVPTILRQYTGGQKVVSGSGDTIADLLANLDGQFPGLRGGRGDLVVTVVVESPRNLAPRQEELLRELAAIRGEEKPTGQVRAGNKSMFGRLRDAFNQH